MALPLLNFRERASEKPSKGQERLRSTPQHTNLSKSTAHEALRRGSNVKRQPGSVAATTTERAGAETSCETLARPLIAVQYENLWRAEGARAERAVRRWSRSTGTMTARQSKRWRQTDRWRRALQRRRRVNLKGTATSSGEPLSDVQGFERENC